MKTYNLNYEGYYVNKDDLPHYAGLYSVYVGTVDTKEEKVSLRELIYIGESGDIYERHHPHNKQAEFDAELRRGEILIYATAHHAEDRLRIQDALIYKVKPKLNGLSTQSFNHPDTEIFTSGKHKFIPSHIIIKKRI